MWTASPPGVAGRPPPAAPWPYVCRLSGVRGHICLREERLWWGH